MKMTRVFMFSCLLILGCAGPKKLADAGNADKGWTKLFNGTDINDWFVKINHHLVGENYGNTFRVEDGMIKVSYDQYGDFNDQFGHLYYKTPFSYYHLRFEYRFVGKQQKGAPDYTLLNSGVMFHSQDPRTMLKDQDWPISIEMQRSGGLGDGNQGQQEICVRPALMLFIKERFRPTIVSILLQKPMTVTSG